jgi:hypothetical protein
VDRADELLELGVRGQDDRRRGRLVDVAHLQADDAVLDVVDDADAVAGADLADPLDQRRQLQALAVQRDRQAALELELDPLRLVGRQPRGGVTSWKTSSSGAWPRSSIQRPSDERPHRLSSIEYGHDLHAALDRDPVLARVGDLLLAAHRPLAHRRDHLQLGRERRDRAVDADLVVALAGAAVRDRVAAAARAYSTASLAISGRPSAVNSG